MKTTYDESVATAGTVPDDLEEIIEKTKGVIRYEDPRYPKGMVTDTLHEHLIRLVSLAEHLDLEEPLKTEILRMIWIHDLPETVLGDQAATLKADGLVGIQDEMTAAKDILSVEDLKLYTNYETSSDFLKGKSEKYDIAGLIVKTVDSIDGNLYFHRHVRDWVVAGNTEFPPKSTLEFTFVQYQKYKERVGMIEETDLKTLLADLLDWEIGQIRDMWEDNEDMIPEGIHTHIS